MKNIFFLVAAVLLLALSVQAQINPPYYKETKSVRFQPVAGGSSLQCSSRDDGLFRAGPEGCQVTASLRGQSSNHPGGGDNEILTGDISTATTGQQAILMFTEMQFANWHVPIDTTKTWVFNNVDLRTNQFGFRPFVEVCDAGIGAGGIFWSTGTYTMTAVRQSTPNQQ